MSRVRLKSETQRCFLVPARKHRPIGDDRDDNNPQCIYGRLALTTSIADVRPAPAGKAGRVTSQEQTYARGEFPDPRYSPMLEINSSSCSNCSANAAAEPCNASSSASLDG